MWDKDEARMYELSREVDRLLVKYYPHLSVTQIDVEKDNDSMTMTIHMDEE